MKGQRIATGLLLVAALALPGCGIEVVHCSRPEIFCVGLVTESGRRDDRSYNQAAWEGLEQSEAEGLADWIAAIETVDARDYEENVGVFVDAGYDVIVTVGSAMDEATRAAALKYPEIYFIGVDQPQAAEDDAIPNLAGVVFPEDQLGFLAGALAAMMSRSGKIGAVCVSDAWPPAQLYGEGYRAGADYVNPAVEASVVYHDEVDLDKSFSDPEWSAAETNGLIDSGADVIFGVGGTTGDEALLTAAKRGAYAVGADMDQFFLLPLAAPKLLTSAMKLVTPAVVDLIGEAKQAQSRAGVFLFGDYAGQVGLAPYHDLDPAIPETVKSRMIELSQALSSGQVETGISGSSP
jgi:basic membrane protein A